MKKKKVTDIKSNRVSATKKQKKATAKSYGVNPARTADGRVPQGRTLSTYDNYLGDGYKTGSTKERPVVVIEANKKNDLAVVPLTTHESKNSTPLNKYQQGQSRFKHYVETTDNEGKPIRVNKKFRENNPKMDLSKRDTEKVKNKVLTSCKQSSENRRKMDKFRK